jgi:hypothetical protein
MRLGGVNVRRQRAQVPQVSLPNTIRTSHDVNNGELIEEARAEVITVGEETITPEEIRN